ncbi:MULTISPECIES: copper resistance CopC/CopD family protein [unclassified Streptomyces]|uniref:copper resistance CopC/CopD family protein n=1 Tax=unclassified Streptomyces TaxID=2593676 RepID=UPI002E29B6F8|nr:copper resistance protein CopC [Streptomyces sp. NBC_00223]
MTRPWRRRCALTLLVLLGALTGLIRTAPPAAAHAYTIATTPSNGSEVTVPPTEVRVTFDEPVTLPVGKGAAGVVDAAGRDAGSGSVRLTGGRRTLVIGMRAGLAKGTYIAGWSVVSSDTHPVGGSIEFGYGVPATAATAPPAPQPSAGLQLVVGAVKGLLYLGLVAAFGVLPAGLVLGADRDERRVLRRVAGAGMLLALVASVLQVVAQYLWDASAVPGGATWAGLRAFAGSGYAGAVLVRAGLLAAALAVLPRLRRAGGAESAGWWAGGAVLALAALGSVVHNGHGGTGSWWYFATTLVHVSAVTAWLGGLAVLGRLMLRRRLTPTRLARLPLWSRYAASSVALLALTGLIQALIQVRYVPALVHTTYGCVLLVKLALVAAALLLGWRGNRWVGRWAGRRGVGRRGAGVGPGDVAAKSPSAGPSAGAVHGLVPPGETARLRGRVRAEAGIGVVIVVVSGVLSSVAPAGAAYAPTRVVHAVVGPYTVIFEVAPARRGLESFRVTAQGAGDTTALPRSVSLDLGQDAGAVEDLRVPFSYRLPGSIRPGRATAFTFVSSSVNVPAAGRWTATLTVVAGPTEQYTTALHYRVL